MPMRQRIIEFFREALQGIPMSQARKPARPVTTNGAYLTTSAGFCG